MKFTMTAECAPKDSDSWFFGFSEGREFEAENQDAAQKCLDQKCREAGTDGDKYYDAYGPFAEAVEE
jgi:hypothetical protein